MVEANGNQLKKLGKRMVPGDFETCHKPVLDCVEAVQKRKGENQPAFMVEVEAEYHNLPEDRKQKLFPVPPRAYLVDLFRDDQLYSDTEQDRYSTYRIDDTYHLYSERMPKVFPEYKFDNQMRLVADTAKTINFDILIKNLLSKDLSILEKDSNHEHAWMFDGQNRFLIGDQDLGHWKTSFCSYPRTGNSMMRKYLEECTGVVTGSDMNLSVSLHSHSMGVKGDQIIDDRTWVTKSHHPVGISGEHQGWKSSKVVMIVRNPIDVIPSLSYLCVSSSHSLVPDQKWHEECPEDWDTMFKCIIQSQKHYYDTMIKDIRSKNIPFHVLRFEDVRTNKYESLKQMMCFLLETDSIDGTVCDELVKKACETEQTKKAIYKMKYTGSNLSRNAHMYTPEQMKYMQEELSEMIHFFGYASHPTQENSTEFFKFENQSDEMLDSYKEFSKHNEESFEKVVKEKDQLKPYGMVHNRDDGSFLMLSMLPNFNDVVKSLGSKTTYFNSK